MTTVGAPNGRGPRFLEPAEPPIATPLRNRKLYISTEPTKAKWREPAYSHALIQNKIDRLRVKFLRGRQAGRESDGYGGRCLELRRGGGREKTEGVGKRRGWR